MAVLPTAEPRATRHTSTRASVFAMMVMSYWEQTCALLNYGLLNEDLFFETTGEFFGVWERVKPIISQAREMFVEKNFLKNLEQAATRYEAWSETRSPGHVAAMRNYMTKMTEQQKAQTTAKAAN